MTSGATQHDLYLVLCAACTVLALLAMIAWARLHPALALMIAALGLGVAAGMPLDRVPAAFTAGVGTMMGHIAIVLGLGAILGALLARSGGAGALGEFLISNCGERGLPWAMLILGIVVGMPVFFEVGLVLLMPLVVEAARRTGKPPILAGLPVLAGLSIVHGTLPPHPAAMLAATEYHADLGKTILWGLVVGLPAGAIAGPGLQWLLMRRWERRVLAGDAEALAAASNGIEMPLGGAALEEHIQGGEAPARENAKASVTEPVPPSAGAARSAVAVLLPIALIFLGSWADSLAVAGTLPNRMLHLIGSPDISLLIAVLAALAMLGPHIQTGRHHGRELLRQMVAESFEPIANVLVILAAAGGLSGILRESGAAQATVGLALGAHMPPLVLAWALAAVVRISMGSATVAMAVAAGVLAPMAGHAGVSPEMLVLATGTGSLILSHVNDPGFWMVLAFFKMDLKGTLSTWSVMETVVSIAGLGAVLVASVMAR